MDISTLNKLHTLEQTIADGQKAMKDRNQLLWDMHKTGEWSYRKLHALLNRTRADVGLPPITLDAIPKAIGRAKRTSS